jgi:peptide/nickel transport system permease protein
MFALATHLLPIGGLTSSNYFELDTIHQILDELKHLIIPVTVLTFVSLAGIQRQMRANLLDVLRAEYVRTARAKGLPEHTVIYHHALRNAINPLITLLGFEFSSLLSGAALTETVLAYPGLGRLTLEGVLTKDMNLVMASLMLGAVMLIVGNLLADVLLKFVDPRITLE